MWSCSSPRKKTPRKNCRLVKQKTPRILSIWGRVLGVLFRYRSIWHKCAACIRRMQYTKGLGLSQQAFCNAKMAFVYTNALLATKLSPLLLLQRKSHFAKAGHKKRCNPHKRLQRSFLPIQFSCSTSAISFAVAVTIRIPLSLIPSSSASSCRRPVLFPAVLSGKKNWSTDMS